MLVPFKASISIMAIFYMRVYFGVMAVYPTAQQQNMQ
jgi:hypothetical protein